MQIRYQCRTAVTMCLLLWSRTSCRQRITALLSSITDTDSLALASKLSIWTMRVTTKINSKVNKLATHSTNTFIRNTLMKVCRIISSVGSLSSYTLSPTKRLVTDSILTYKVCHIYTQAIHTNQSYSLLMCFRIKIHHCTNSSYFSRCLSSVETETLKPTRQMSRLWEISRRSFPS